jgi:hypothetical protein
VSIGESATCGVLGAKQEDKRRIIRSLESPERVLRLRVG